LLALEEPALALLELTGKILLLNAALVQLTLGLAQLGQQGARLRRLRQRLGLGALTPRLLGRSRGLADAFLRCRSCRAHPLLRLTLSALDLSDAALRLGLDPFAIRRIRGPGPQAGGCGRG